MKSKQRPIGPGVLIALAVALLFLCSVCLCAGLYLVLFTSTSTSQPPPPARVPEPTGPADNSSAVPLAADSPLAAGPLPASDQVPSLGPPHTVGAASSEPIPVGPADRILIVEADRPLGFSLIDDLNACEVRSYDLSTGDLLGKVAMDRSTRALLAGSPDGERVVIADSYSSARDLRLIRLTGATGLEAEWTAYENADVRWARFVSADRLLTCSKHNRLRMWQLPPATLVYESALQWKGGETQFTPDRRYLYDVDMNTVRFVDVQTGEFAAAVPLPSLHAGSRLDSPAWSPDGGKFCAFALLPGANTSMLGCWDMKTRQRLLLVDKPKLARAPQWLGNDYIIAGDYLFEVRTGRFLWRLTNFRAVAIRPDGQCWMQAGFGNDQVLSLVTVPDADLLAQLQARREQVEPFATHGDGISIEIDMQVQPPSAESDFESRLLTLLTQRVTAAGYRVAEDQPRILKAVVTELDSGEEVLFEELGEPGIVGERGTGKTRSVPDVAVVCQIDLVDLSGKSYYHIERSRSPDNEYGKLHVTAWQNFSKMLMNRRWTSLLDQLRLSVNLNPQYQAFELGESSVRVELDPQWAEKRTEMARRKRQAEYDREREKILLPDRRERPPWEVETAGSTSDRSPRPARPITLGQGRIRRMVIASSGAKLAAVHFQSDRNETYLDRYDLETSRRIGRQSIPSTARLLDLRPDGQLGLLSTDSSGCSLQVIQYENDARTVALALDVSSKHTRVDQAVFGGRDRLLTIGDGRLCLWALPSKQLVHERRTSLSQCIVSPDRRYFLDLHQGRIAFFRVSDGVLAGELEALSDRIERIQCAAFHDQSKQIAVVTSRERGNSGYINIWSIEDGSLNQQFHTQHIGGTVAWCGTRYLLTGNKLFHLEMETPVWNYPDLPLSCSNGTAWFGIQDRAELQSIVAIPIPSDEVKRQIQLVLAKAPMSLQPGDEVSVQVTITSSYPRADEIEPRLRQLFTQKLQEGGFNVTEDANRVLRVLWGAVSSGVRMTPFGFEQGEQIFTLPDQDCVATVSLLGGEGVSIWNTSVAVYLPAVDYQVDWQADDPKLHLQRQLDDILLKRLQGLRIPTRRLQKSRVTIGSSIINPEGERALLNGAFISLGI